MTADSFLFDAGWVFFLAWIMVIAAVSAAAFGRDFFPSPTPSKGASASRSQDSVRTRGPAKP
jgi:hypothetical protein